MKGSQMFSFLNEAVWLRRKCGILAPLPVLIMDMLKTRLGGSELLLRQHKELFPQRKLRAKSGRRWL